jgi:hypothetical protein
MAYSLFSGHFHALCAIIASVAALEAFVALWAATSRHHWFWRALSVWAAITALLPIRAYQPALVFAISSSLLVALIVLVPTVLPGNFLPLLVPRLPPGNALTRGSSLAEAPTTSPFRFSLRDLMLAMVVVGLSMASLTHLLPRLGSVNFAELAFATAAQLTIPFVVWQSVTSARPRLARLLVVVVLAGFTTAAFAGHRWIGSTWPLLEVLFENSPARGCLAVLVTCCELALLLLFAIPSIQPRKVPRPRWLQLSLVVAPAFALTVLTLIYWQMLWLLPLPPPFSTAPTHHGRLMVISDQIRGLPSPTTSAARVQRQALIDETIRLVQEENHVPYDPVDGISLDVWNALMMPSQHSRDLARALDADTKDALAAGDYDRACTLTLANIRLGLMLRRGGAIIEFLIGTAIHGFAFQPLVKMRAEVSPDQARRIIATLQEALDEQEDLEAIKYRDRALAERAYGWAGRLSSILDAAGLRSAPNLVEPQLRTIVTTRLLQTDLAIRLFQHDNNHLPQRLDDLVPNYLPAMPLDPYSQQPLIYKPTGNAFVLYSVGFDRTDNGGNFTNAKTYYSTYRPSRFSRPHSGYDFDLETITRP